MVRSSLSAALVVLPVLVAGLGCAPDFEPASTLNSLRVLAVQKDKPYALPGDTVTLRMLVTDSSPGGPRPIEIVWLGAFCENPPGDLYAGCITKFVSAGGGRAIPDNIYQGNGPVFQMPISPTIISRRPKPLNPKQYPYGNSFVFFTACAGHIDVAPEAHLDTLADGGIPQAFPLGCFSPTGARLDQSSFVVGYTEVFASVDVHNENPVVTGFEIDGQPNVPIDCIGAKCIPPLDTGLGGDAGLPPGAAPGTPSDGGGLDAALADAGVVDSGSPPAAGTDAGGFKLPEADPCEADSPGVACIDVCTKEKQDDCPKHTIKLLVDGDRENADYDKNASNIEGHKVYEQGWINYYTEGGKIPVEVKLLSDATLGFQDKAETKILAPKKKGPFHIWAVAHDNRGGAQWVRLRMSAH